MKNVFIINAHEYHPFSEGKLNRTLVDLAKSHLEKKGYEVKVTTMKDSYDEEEEVKKHVWADAVILQTPVYWMGVPWSFKKYMDCVYSEGIEGELCEGDGRSDPSKQYGTGGSLEGKKYMLSLTFNAPKEAFDDPDQYLFQGRSVDDLFWPMHMTFRFFAMTPLETFVCYDVIEDPDVENDFKRFEKHLNKQFPAL